MAKATIHKHRVFPSTLVKLVETKFKPYASLSRIIISVNKITIDETQKKEFLLSI
tara:strand:+ start:3356 stop:3520 length:165 start_codon:yes stop_codon:yes gene_type:complete